MENTASSFRFFDNQKPGTPETGGRANGTVIGAGVVIKGSIAASGDIAIAGTVEGDVASQARLVVAPGGSITGSLQAIEIVVAGKVQGDSAASKSITMQANAEVRGDVSTPQIVIEPGATFVGRCSMPQSAA